jgi:hypothetical protein
MKEYCYEQTRIVTVSDWMIWKKKYFQSIWSKKRNIKICKINLFTISQIQKGNLNVFAGMHVDKSVKVFAIFILFLV